MAYRFLAPDAAASGVELALSDGEARHASRTLRLRSGARVSVFNGRGQEWDAVITAVDARHTRVRLLDPLTPAREPRTPITLAMAVLKADRMDVVVRDAVMLGVAAIQPLLTAHVDVPRARVERAYQTGRWARLAVASAKQSGRAVVPDVSAPTDFGSALQTMLTPVRVFLVEPSPESDPLGSHAIPIPKGPVTLFVGPEGGWADNEIAQAAAAGCLLVTLGEITLRAAATPLVALSVLRTCWRDW